MSIQNIIYDVEKVDLIYSCVQKSNFRIDQNNFCIERNNFFLTLTLYMRLLKFQIRNGTRKGTRTFERFQISRTI